MKKILFIIPPSFDIKDYSCNIHNKAPVFTTPYGVLSILSYLKSHSKYKVNARILDLNLEVYKCYELGSDINTIIATLIKKEILDFNPNIIGIAALFNICYPYLEIISKSVSDLKINTPLLIGGGVATNLYTEVLEEFSRIDAACYAEGERPVCELIDAENEYEYLEASTAWITRKKIKENRLPEALYVENLDDIPFLDYDIIDIDQYQGRAFSTMYREKKNRELSIHTSRGCPFNCVFCANGSVHGKIIRYMSIERVLQDIEKMVKDYEVNVLLIEDDHFLSNKSRAKAILEVVSALNIRLEFPNGLAVYAIDDEIANLLKKAGTVTATLAVESGSDYVLKNIIEKPLKVNMIQKVVTSLRKNNIKYTWFFCIRTTR